MNLQNIQIKKILYATDLSENAVHAFSYAVSFANTYGADNYGSSCADEIPRRRIHIEHDQYRHMERDQSAALFRSPGSTHRNGVFVVFEFG